MEARNFHHFSSSYLWGAIGTIDYVEYRKDGAKWNSQVVTKLG